MIDVILSAADAQTLRQQLLQEPEEACAVLIASEHRRRDGLVRLLVREILQPEEADYDRRGKFEAQLSPSFVSKTAKRAIRHGLTLVFVHSHPGAEPPEFSPIDDAGEHALCGYLEMRLQGKTFASVVVSEGGWACRELGHRTPARLVVLGEQRVVLASSSKTEPVEESFDRQVRAFGQAGQRAIGALRVAIVGLGGTGSIAAEQLAHLGVRNFVLVDPDTIEASNLNRVVGASAGDIGRAKVEVAAEMLRGISDSIRCDTVAGDVVISSVAERLLDADILFGCTDSHGSRAVLQQVSYQYLIPCFDIGTTIAVSSGMVNAIIGRVQLLCPGLACFTCSGLLDSEAVRRDMMSEAERKLDPYMPGSFEPAPSVISLNGTVVSLAVTMFMAFVAGVPSAGRYLIYNARDSSLRRVQAQPAESCFCCSRKGCYARGESSELFLRQG